MSWAQGHPDHSEIISKKSQKTNKKDFDGPPLYGILRYTRLLPLATNFGIIKTKMYLKCDNYYLPSINKWICYWQGRKPAFHLHWIPTIVWSISNHLKPFWKQLTRYFSGQYQRTVMSQLFMYCFHTLILLFKIRTYYVILDGLQFSNHPPVLAFRMLGL